MKKFLIIVGTLLILSSCLTSLAPYLGIDAVLSLLLGSLPVLGLAAVLLGVGAISLIGGILLPSGKPEVYQPLSLGGQKVNSGTALNSAPSIIADKAETEKDEEDFIDTARRIAGEPWEVIRMYGSRDDGPWYLFLCIQNAAGKRETLELSESHSEYTDYFFLKEGNKITFTFTEKNLDPDGSEEFVTDYLHIERVT